MNYSALNRKLASAERCDLPCLDNFETFKYTRQKNLKLSLTQDAEEEKIRRKSLSDEEVSDDEL